MQLNIFYNLKYVYKILKNLVHKKIYIWLLTKYLRLLYKIFYNVNSV